MFLGGGLITAYAAPVSVTIPSFSFDNEAFKPGNTICYSGCRFDSDGNVYRMSATGSFGSGKSWLLDGAASSYWLFRTLDTGSITNDDGDGNQLNTDNLDYWISTAVSWFTRVESVTFQISDDSSNSNTLATRQYTFSAYLQGSGTPP